MINPLQISSGKNQTSLWLWQLFIHCIYNRSETISEFTHCYTLNSAKIAFDVFRVPRSCNVQVSWNRSRICSSAFQLCGPLSPLRCVSFLQRTGAYISPDCVDILYGIFRLSRCDDLYDLVSFSLLFIRAIPLQRIWV